LTVSEYGKVLKYYYEIPGANIEPEYEALLAAMKKLASFNNDVRVVIWFDN